MLKKSIVRITSVFLIGMMMFIWFTQISYALNTQNIKVQQAINGILNKYFVKAHLSNWEAYGLLANDKNLDDTFIESLKNEIINKNGEYRLATDYARIILILRKAGLSPLDFEGFNLVNKLYNSSNMMLQGVNGPIFSIISTYGLNKPEGLIYNDEKLLVEILDHQNSDGGFSLANGGESSVDLTAMALYALSYFNYREDIKIGIDKALTFLSNSLADDGYYYYMGAESSESIAQVIIALCKLSLDPTDKRFIRKDKTLVDTLLMFMVSDGAFTHTLKGQADDIATEQALLALTAYNCYIEGLGGIYDMQQSESFVFSDMNAVSNWAREYIVKAKKLGIALGDQNSNINPKDALTRAQFVTLLVRMLNLEPAFEYKSIFSDVSSASWYWAAVECAYDKKIIRGKGDNTFAPDNYLSNQDFCVIINNTFCLDKKTQTDIKDIDSVSDYAKNAVNTLLNAGVWHSDDSGLFSPFNNITREQAIAALVIIHENGAKQKEVN